MTVRHAYFPPGHDEPTHIFDSMASVIDHAKTIGDPMPRTMPVTLGILESPTQQDIVDWVCEALDTGNPTWERGWNEYLADLGAEIQFAAARLAAAINGYMTRRPGYVVDTRDLEHLRTMAGTDEIQTPDWNEEEE